MTAEAAGVTRFSISRISIISAFTQKALEQVLEAELDGPGAVGVDGMQEVTGLKTAGVARGAIGVTVAGNYVVACVAGMRRIIDAELGVIEKVEGLKAELQRTRFTEGEALAKLHVEIGTVGIAEEIAAGVSEGQSRRSNKFPGIANKRTKSVTISAGAEGNTQGAGGDVRIRSGTDDGDDAGIVGDADAIDGASVQNAEGSSRLVDGDAAKFPAIPNSVAERFGHAVAV